jgi:hypothetical protein
MKIDLPFDDFTEIAEALIEQARGRRSPHLLRVAARILREQWSTAVANAIEAEAEKLEEALSTNPTDPPEQCS